MPSLKKNMLKLRRSQKSTQKKNAMKKNNKHQKSKKNLKKKSKKKMVGGDQPTLEDLIKCLENPLYQRKVGYDDEKEEIGETAIPYEYRTDDHEDKGPYKPYYFSDDKIVEKFPYNSDWKYYKDTDDYKISMKKPVNLFKDNNQTILEKYKISFNETDGQFYQTNIVATEFFDKFVEEIKKIKDKLEVIKMTCKYGNQFLLEKLLNDTDYMEGLDIHKPLEELQYVTGDRKYTNYHIDNDPPIMICLKSGKDSDQPSWGLSTQYYKECFHLLFEEEGWKQYVDYYIGRCEQNSLDKRGHFHYNKELEQQFLLALRNEKESRGSVGNIKHPPPDTSPEPGSPPSEGGVIKKGMVEKKGAFGFDTGYKERNFILTKEEGQPVINYYQGDSNQPKNLKGRITDITEAVHNEGNDWKIITPKRTYVCRSANAQEWVTEINNNLPKEILH